MLDYAGLRVAEMTDAQRKQLLDLIALYVDNMDDGPRASRWTRCGVTSTRPGSRGSGKTDDGVVFYYRIHSPWS